MELQSSTLYMKNFVQEFKNILEDDILLSNVGGIVSGVSSSQGLQFELGHKNKKLDKSTKERNYESGFDEEHKFYKRYYGLDSKEWKKNLWEIHPGNVNLSELVEAMKPVSVPGLDKLKYTEGIHGAVEGIDFNVGADGHSNGDQVLENALVWVHYALFLEGENIPFDSSVKRRRGKPEILIASPDSLIPSLAMAIRWLKVGQRGRFVLPPSAYGQLGLFGTVPPDTSVLLLLHVMRALDAGALHRYDMLNEESKKDFNKIIYYVESANELARDFFFRKRISESIDIYKKSIEMLNACERNKTNNDMINELLLKTYINLALSVTKDRKGNVHQALDYLDCASGIKHYETNCKAHFLRGRCNMQLNNYEEAQIYLLKAFNLEPYNEEIGEELEKLDKVLKQSKSVEKTIAKKYVNRATELDEKEIKLREMFVSRDDILKIKQSIKTLETTHGIVAPGTWPLLKEEVNLLKDLVNNKHTTFYTRK